MSTTMWDAREALIPGSAYDRTGNTGFNGGMLFILIMRKNNDRSYMYILFLHD